MESDLRNVFKSGIALTSGELADSGNGRYRPLATAVA